MPLPRDVSNKYLTSPGVPTVGIRLCLSTEQRLPRGPGYVVPGVQLVQDRVSSQPTRTNRGEVDGCVIWNSRPVEHFLFYLRDLGHHGRRRMPVCNIRYISLVRLVLQRVVGGTYSVVDTTCSVSFGFTYFPSFPHSGRVTSLRGDNLTSIRVPYLSVSVFLPLCHPCRTLTTELLWPLPHEHYHCNS